MSSSLLQVESSRQATYRRLAAFFAMLAVAMVYRADYYTDWDSWDYSAQAIQGHSSDLLLGRWWFIAIMRVTYLLGQIVMGAASPEQAATDACMAMQTCSAVMMALALVALMAWTNRLTKSIGAELLVAALILPGPLIGIYASSVMTESLTVLTLSLAFLAWESALGRVPKMTKNADGAGAPVAAASPPGLVGPDMLAFLAGCAFGITVDVREPAALFCAWPIISCFVDRPQGRWRLLSLAILGTIVTLGLGVAGGWAWYPWMKRTYFDNMISWTAMMSNERKQFSVSITGNLVTMWLYACGTAAIVAFLAVPAVIWSFLRRSRLGWLGLACVPYSLSLLMNHDLNVNPRFLIPLVWILAPVVAGAIAALVLKGSRLYRLRLAGATLALAGSGLALLWTQWVWFDRYYFPYAKTMYETYQGVLRDVPDGSTVIPGPSTPVIMHINRLRLRNYDLIQSGWAWPGKDLKARLQRRFARGQNVYINIRKKDWTNGVRDDGEWQTLMDAIEGCQLCPDTFPLVRILPPQADTRPNAQSQPTEN